MDVSYSILLQMGAGASSPSHVVASGGLLALLWHLDLALQLSTLVGGVRDGAARDARHVGVFWCCMDMVWFELRTEGDEERQVLVRVVQEREE